MKTEILKIKGDWGEVLSDCRLTVGKPPLGKEPSAAWKRGILIAEHSPIRDLSVRFRWRGIKYWVAMHWKTHHWESKVTSQRSDRTGIPRDKLPQDQLLDFTGEMNAQAAIDTMRKRLCRQASPETPCLCGGLQGGAPRLRAGAGRYPGPQLRLPLRLPRDEDLRLVGPDAPEDRRSPGLHPHRRALRALQPPLPGGPEK